jgi:HK97 family phage major capsid protein
MMGVSGPVPMTLFGKPILFTEKTPTLGTKGDVMLVDFSQYAIGLRQEVIVDSSLSPGWTQDKTSYRVIVRVDGIGTWNEAIAPFSGGNTLSWCVILN